MKITKQQMLAIADRIEEYAEEERGKNSNPYEQINFELLISASLHYVAKAIRAELQTRGEDK